jgi:glycosyltransferase involved in cell wall biosynthesis
MRILILATRYPYPAVKGDQQRLLHLIEELGQKHTIDFICTSEQPVSEEAYTYLRQKVTSLIVLSLGKAERLAWLLILPFIQRLPFEVAFFYSWHMKSAVQKQLRLSKYDVIFCQMLRSVPYLPRDIDVPVVVDFQDAYSLNMKKRYESEKGIIKLIAFVEWKLLERYEKKIMREHPIGTVVSKRDWVSLGSPKNLAVVPIGVSTCSPLAKKIPRRLVFSGNLRYFPNRDAITWFCREVFPRVIQHDPGVSLDIVGANPSDDVIALGVENRVKIYANVSSVQKYLARASLAVVPMRSGSGTQFKVIEAMACATPVLLSPYAAQGLDFLSPDDFVSSPCDAKVFADTIIKLLQDEEMLADMAKRGQKKVLAHYDWSNIARQFEHVMLSAIRQFATGAHINNESD